MKMTKKENGYEVTLSIKGVKVNFFANSEKEAFELVNKIMN
jgi:hypothetical protein